MLQEALDFKAESDALYALMQDMDAAAYDAPTQFKGWTLNNVLEHLHMWNWAANESYVDEDNFAAWLGDAMQAIGKSSMRAYEADWNEGVKGRDLLEKWHDFYTDMAARFVEVDPKKRLKWAGPDMSARSSISARLMETWAHGQEVFDQLGVVRENATPFVPSPYWEQIHLAGPMQPAAKRRRARCLCQIGRAIGRCLGIWRALRRRTH